MPTLVLKLKGRELKRQEIHTTQLLIGRDASCDLVIDNQSVSRRHAKLVHAEGGFVIIDLDSRNGVLQNGERVPQAPLVPGSSVQIGKFVLCLEEAGGPPIEDLRRVQLGEQQGFAAIETVQLSAKDFSRMRTGDQDPSEPTPEPPPHAPSPPEPSPKSANARTVWVAVIVAVAVSALWAILG